MNYRYLRIYIFSDCLSKNISPPSEIPIQKAKWFVWLFVRFFGCTTKNTKEEGKKLREQESMLKGSLS